MTFRLACIGMTLIEMVVVIVVIGVIGTGLATFAISPVRGYTEIVRRLQLVEQADFALRRISRDMGAALPNSVRTTASGQDSILEFLNVRSAARYCNGAGCGGALFDGDNTFAWSSPAGLSVVAGDFIVVANGVNSDCDAYATSPNNRRTVGSTTGNSITFIGAAFNSSCTERRQRFFVVDGPVAYACEAASSTLWRYSGYAIQSTIASSISALNTLSGVVKARVATEVQCASTNFNITATNENLVEIRIQLMSNAAEKVNLYRQFRLEQAI
jgi:MSHA biogenesis protein MshO